MGESFLSLGSAPEFLSIKVLLHLLYEKVPPESLNVRWLSFFPPALVSKGLTFKFYEMTPWTPDLKTYLNCGVF